MRAPFLSALLIAVVASASAGAQGVAIPPPNSDATEPVAPSATPEDLVRRSAAEAARGNLPAAVKDDITALHRGPLLVHGNYCGVGNRPGTPPVDRLDAACMHHDACTKTNTLPTCACNDRLRVEATAVAEDPRTPAELQAMAATVAASMTVLVCR